MAESKITADVAADWSDLTPIPQAETNNPMVPIAYTAEYRELMNLFRALVQRGEYSKRGVELTGKLVTLNPAHYSVWAWRTQTLLELSKREPDSKYLLDELEYLDNLVKAHLKSYQIWQHRRNIVIALNDSGKELQFVDRALAIDPKNYHTWAYRQWVLCHFDDAKLWVGELPFVDGMLNYDIRNNSAWNHRFFLLFESPFAPPLADTAEAEIDFCKSKILQAPNNASAWNYLRGILARSKIPLKELVTFAEPLTKTRSQVFNEQDQTCLVEGLARGAQLPCVSAVEFVADGYAEQVKDGQGQHSQDAIDLYDMLSKDLDPIRSKYWAYRSAKVVQLTNKATTAVSS